MCVCHTNNASILCVFEINALAHIEFCALNVILKSKFDLKTIKLLLGTMVI